jgi:hypothetical protein
MDERRHDRKLAAGGPAPAFTALGFFACHTYPCLAIVQVMLEPLDGDNEGIFFLSLCRPEARNSIGRQVRLRLAWSPSLVLCAYQNLEGAAAPSPCCSFCVSCGNACTLWRKNEPRAAL